MNQNVLLYYFKGNTARKRFDDFSNGIKLFEKTKSGETKLEEAKKMKNEFNSSLNEISKRRHKSKVQKVHWKIPYIALQITRCCYQIIQELFFKCI